jgi:hypothetical protein
MHEPNFFIIGAPKCGTSAMHEYLTEHPQIFMSRLKEPHHYAADFPGYGFDKDDYLKLFRPARPEHQFRGESSVYYLYSDVALPRLMHERPDARIVVMLRNPCELVYSLHAQHLVGLTEDLSDFREAWEAQDARLRGERVPPHCPEARLLQYRKIGALGEQLARARQHVPAKQLHVILFDDFKRDPKQSHDRVLQFLNLPLEGCTNFRRINPNTQLRSRWIRALLDQRRIPAILRRWGREIGLHQVHRAMLKINEFPVERPPLDPEMRRELVAAFQDDVGHLSDQVQRDLSHWLAV